MNRQCSRCLSSTFPLLAEAVNGRVIFGLGCEFCKELKVRHQVPKGSFGSVYIAEHACTAPSPYAFGRLEQNEVPLVPKKKRRK